MRKYTALIIIVVAIDSLKVFAAYVREIVPATTYEVRMDIGSPEAPHFTAASTVDTAPWGDLVGVFVDGEWTPPDGDVTFLDVSAGVECFVSSPVAPPRERCDINPAVPDNVIDFVDILYAVRGFQGVAYPFEEPDPCP